jgi:hypothetical protein
MTIRRFCARALVSAAVSASLHAQLGRREAEWMTNGADAQRSHWIVADGKISPERLLEINEAKSGFQFLWKL